MQGRGRIKAWVSRDPGSAAPPSSSLASLPCPGRAAQTGEAPRINGVLDETAWRAAEVIDSFTQQEPHEGQPATDRRCACSTIRATSTSACARVDADWRSAGVFR